MKRIITAPLTAIGLLMGSTGIAHADTDQFITDAHSAGFTNQGGNEAIITVGQTICDAVMSGESPAAVSHDLFHASNLSSLDMASALVGIAVKDLCPPGTVT